MKFNRRFLVFSRMDHNFALYCLSYTISIQNGPVCSLLLGWATKMGLLGPKKALASFLIKRDSMENKPASSLVVSLGKALNGMPLPLSGLHWQYKGQWLRSSVGKAPG